MTILQIATPTPQLDTVWDLILGPTGGAMAFCFMVGIVVGWIGRQKVFEKLLQDRDSENRKRIEALQARNDALWYRIAGQSQLPAVDYPPAPNDPPPPA